jgi:hypothetical protein
MSSLYEKRRGIERLIEYPILRNEITGRSEVNCMLFLLHLSMSLGPGPGANMDPPIAIHCPVGRRLCLAYVDGSERLPKRTFPLMLDVNGKLYDMLGYGITINELSWDLRPTDHATGPNPPSYLLIWFSDTLNQHPRTKAWLFFRVLFHVVTHADPNRETVLFIQGLTHSRHQENCALDDRRD